MKNEISEKIKDIRNTYNLSQDRFARKIGLSGKTISAYESGRCTPPIKVLEKISKTYNVAFVNLTEQGEQRLKSKIEELQNSINELRYIVQSSKN